MAFFSKVSVSFQNLPCYISNERERHAEQQEKISYDDYNLACIVTFPPCQNRGFGKLLIEFSAYLSPRLHGPYGTALRPGYYLTKHPSTRSATGTPGTPERPLSDLGRKGYMAYWVSTILRVLRELLSTAQETSTGDGKPTTKPSGRATRAGRQAETSSIFVHDVGMSSLSRLLYKACEKEQC